MNCTIVLCDLAKFSVCFVCKNVKVSYYFHRFGGVCGGDKGQSPAQCHGLYSGEWDPREVDHIVCCATVAVWVDTIVRCVFV